MDKNKNKQQKQKQNQKQKNGSTSRACNRVCSMSMFTEARMADIRERDRGNKGIGLEVVRGLSRAGFDVLLAARDAERGHAAVAALQSDGFAASFVKLDVTKPETIAAAAEYAKSTGGLDVLVRVCAWCPTFSTFV